METESVLTSLFNIGSVFGVPMLILSIVLYIFVKYTPKMLDVYMNTKKLEQESFIKRQEHYDTQTNRIIEVAVLATAALDRNTAVNQSVILTMDKMKDSISNLNDKSVEHSRIIGEMRTKLNEIVG